MPRLTESLIRRRSNQILNEEAAKSTIFSSRKEENILRLAPYKVEAGRLLGQGKFCSVLAVDNVYLGYENKKKVHVHNHKRVAEDHNSSSDNILSDRKCHYTIKKMNEGVFQKYGPLEFAVAVIDLAAEAKLLSVIQHKHIIKMRALADVDYCSEDFFILLDRLNMNLNEKFCVWKRDMPRGYGEVTRNMKNRLFCERLGVGHDICSALDYLHKNRIVYRDLKPDNIGFDMTGEVKLFNFGLATEMSEEQRVKGTSSYLLTKNTGSLRYMAPEVFRGDPYNEKCDVYSFGLILWQCSELMVPYNTFSDREIVSLVHTGKVSPTIYNPEWNKRLKALFDVCLSIDFQRRYDCESIMMILKTEIKAISSMIW